METVGLTLRVRIGLTLGVRVGLTIGGTTGCEELSAEKWERKDNNVQQKVMMMYQRKNQQVKRWIES